MHAVMNKPTLTLYLHAAMSGVSELPFLDLGDESRVPGEGKFFGDDDSTEDATELLNSIPFPFGNSTETSVYVSLKKLFKCSNIKTTVQLLNHRFQVMDS